MQFRPGRMEKAGKLKRAGEYDYQERKSKYVPTIDGGGDGVGGGDSHPPTPSPLPCLFRNNSDNAIGKALRELTGAERKRAHTCHVNVEHFINTYGLERCGFLTLTHPEKLPITWQEFQRRYNNARRRYITACFIDTMGALEISPASRPHIHLVVACSVDIKTGFDFEYYDRCQIWQKSGRHGLKPVGSLGRCDWLKEMHASLNDRLPDYGLGRPELVPIRKSAEAVGYYIGGYLSKSIPNRLPEHKGARFMRYSKTAPRIIKGNFAWLGVHSWLWRQKLAVFAARHDCQDENDLASLFGVHWSYHMRAAILATELTYYITGHHAVADGRGVDGMDLDQPYIPSCERTLNGYQARKLMADFETKKTLVKINLSVEKQEKSLTTMLANQEWEMANWPF